MTFFIHPLDVCILKHYENMPDIFSNNKIMTFYWLLTRYLWELLNNNTFPEFHHSNCLQKLFAKLCDNDCNFATEYCKICDIGIEFFLPSPSRSVLHIQYTYRSFKIRFYFYFFSYMFVYMYAMQSLHIFINWIILMAFFFLQ